MRCWGFSAAMPCLAGGVCSVFFLKNAPVEGSQRLSIQLSHPTLFLPWKHLRTLEKLQICLHLELSIVHEFWHMCCHSYKKCCVKSSFDLVNYWESYEVLRNWWSSEKVVKFCIFSSYSEKTAESWLFGHFCIALTCGICLYVQGSGPKND